MKRTIVPQTIAIRAASCLAAVALTAGLTSTASAALAGYEGFAGYAPGELAGQTTGTATGFSETAWNGSDGFGSVPSNKLVQETGLSYTNGATLVTSGGSLKTNGSFNRAHRGLTTAIDPGVPGGGSLWIAYLFQSGPNVEDGNQVRFYTSGTNFDGQTISADVSRVWAPDPSNPNHANHLKQQVQSRLWNQEGTGGGSNAFRPAGETNLILMEYQLDDSDAPGNQGVARMYVNPVIGGAAPDPSTAATSQVAGDYDPMTRLSLFSPGAGGYAITWDEIRWGSTFADVTPVVPEPAAIGSLVGVAGLALARRRRCR